MPAQWALFVDESGRFAEADAVSVAGVLAKSPLEHHLRGPLRDALARELPHVPWPPHRWLLNHPSAHLLWHARTGNRHVADAQLRALYDSAAVALAGCCADEWTAADTATSEGREPVRSALVALDRAMPPDARAALQAEVRRAAETLARIAASVAALPPQRNPHALLVAAGEAADRDAAAFPRGVGDRYLALLDAVIERAADLLLDRPGEHTLVLEVLARRLATGAPLAPDDLWSAARRVLGPEAMRTRGASTVRVFSCNVRAWSFAKPRPGGTARATTDNAWFVFADTAANASRRLLGSPTRLAAAQAELACLLPLPNTSDRSHLAAGGTLGEELHAARTQRRAPAFPAERRWRSWALEQAAQWATLPW